MSPGGCEYIDIEELLYFRNCKVRPKRNPEVVNLNSLRKTGTVVFQSFCQKRLCYVQAFSDFIQIAVSGLKRLDKPLKHRHPVKCQAARLQFLLSVPGFCLIKNIPGINIIMRNLFDQDACFLSTADQSVAQINQSIIDHAVGTRFYESILMDKKITVISILQQLFVFSHENPPLFLFVKNVLVGAGEALLPFVQHRGAFYPVGLARWHGHYAQRSEQEFPA